VESKKNKSQGILTAEESEMMFSGIIAAERRNTELARQNSKKLD